MTRTAYGLSLIISLGIVAVSADTWRPVAISAQGLTPANAKLAAIAQADMKEWLTYLSSDALQGRQVYTEGYGLAASYVAEHLKSWGVKPMGDAGYFQTVKLRSYRVTRNSAGVAKRVYVTLDNNQEVDITDPWQWATGVMYFEADLKKAKGG